MDNLRLVKIKELNIWTAEICLYCGEGIKGYELEEDEKGFNVRCYNCDSILATRETVN